MIESALVKKLHDAQREFDSIDTAPERKFVINKIIESIKRDMARLGLKDDPAALKQHGITNYDI